MPLLPKYFCPIDYDYQNTEHLSLIPRSWGVSHYVLNSGGLPGHLRIYQTLVKIPPGNEKIEFRIRLKG